MKLFRNPLRRNVAPAGPNNVLDVESSRARRPSPDLFPTCRGYLSFSNVNFVSSIWQIQKNISNQISYQVHRIKSNSILLTSPVPGLRFTILSSAWAIAPPLVKSRVSAAARRSSLRSPTSLRLKLCRYLQPKFKIRKVLELIYDCQKHIATEPRSDRRPSNESAFQSFGRCLPWT